MQFINFKFYNFINDAKTNNDNIMKNEENFIWIWSGL